MVCSNTSLTLIRAFSRLDNLPTDVNLAVWPEAEGSIMGLGEPQDEKTSSNPKKKNLEESRFFIAKDFNTIQNSFG